MRSCEFVARFAEEVEQVAGLFEGHINALRGIIDDTERGYEERGDDGKALSIGAVFVIEAVFARDKGDAEADRRVMTAFDGADEHTELCGVSWIAPAKIVQNGGEFEVASNGGQV